MKERNRKSASTIGSSRRNQFALAAQSFIAALRDVGNRIEAANAFVTKARQMRGRDVESLSVTYDFRPKGRLYGCFMACCRALDSVSACEPRLLCALRKKMAWFEKELNAYLGGESCAREVAEFTTLVDRMLDLEKPSTPFEVRDESRLIPMMGKDAMHKICVCAKVREMQLRRPVEPMPEPEYSRPVASIQALREETKRELCMLVRQIKHDDEEFLTINEAVERIMSAKPGVLYYARAERIKKNIHRLGWSISTMRQYAKDIGKHSCSQQGARMQAAKRRKKKLVQRDLKTWHPPL